MSSTNQNISIRDVWKAFRQRKTAVIACGILGFWIFAAVFADFIANESPLYCVYQGESYFPAFTPNRLDTLHNEVTGKNQVLVFHKVNWKERPVDFVIWPLVPYGPDPYRSRNRLSPFGDQTLPNSDEVLHGKFRHHLGTTSKGVDLLAGLIHGARISLKVGFIAIFIAFLIGVLLGSLAGYFGDKVDILISRLIEVFNSLPRLLLIISIAAVFERSLELIMIIIGFTSWPGIARITRAEVLKVRALEHIESVRALGLSHTHILLRHILPNSLAPVIVVLTIGIGQAIIAESSLSFLNLVDNSQSWGGILSSARSYFSDWWLAVFPGISIFLTVLSINLIGERLRDVTDPRTHSDL
ncbi:UNVERIFIED_CONTAM: hypothetical protein GTU68_057526 [Idotea baltica]|nr:hypothetical protein [Idotea baltica]